MASLNFARRGSLLAAAPLLGAAAPFLLAMAAVQEKWRENPAASVLGAAGLCAEACARQQIGVQEVGAQPGTERDWYLRNGCAVNKAFCLMGVDLKAITVGG